MERDLRDRLDFFGPISRPTVFREPPQIEYTILSSGHRITLVLPRLEKCPLGPQTCNLAMSVTKKPGLAPVSGTTIMIPTMIISCSVDWELTMCQLCAEAWPAYGYPKKCILLPSPSL